MQECGQGLGVVITVQQLFGLPMESLDLAEHVINAKAGSRLA